MGKCRKQAEEGDGVGDSDKYNGDNPLQLVEQIQIQLTVEHKSLVREDLAFSRMCTFWSSLGRSKFTFVKNEKISGAPRAWTLRTLNYECRDISDPVRIKDQDGPEE